MVTWFYIAYSPIHIIVGSLGPPLYIHIRTSDAYTYFVLHIIKQYGHHIWSCVRCYYNFLIACPFTLFHVKCLQNRDPISILLLEYNIGIYGPHTNRDRVGSSDALYPSTNAHSYVHPFFAQYHTEYLSFICSLVNMRTAMCADALVCIVFMCQWRMAPWNGYYTYYFSQMWQLELYYYYCRNRSPYNV